MNGIELFEAMDCVEDTYLEEALQEEFNYGQYGRRRWKRMVIAVAASFVLAFVGIVNLFPTVALAMNDVILLKDLARAVTFDPSMRACLENEYAQYVGEEQITEDGHYSKVYYMVVDAGRISIYYKTDVPKDAEDLYSYVLVKGKDGEDIGKACCLLDTEIEGLHEIQVDFVNEEIPDEIQLEVCYAEPVTVNMDNGESYDVADWVENPGSKSVYHLYIEQEYRTVMKSFDIQQEVEVSGQILWIERLEIYPTQARLLFHENETNAEILLNIDIVLVDDKGREYGQRENGITGFATEEMTTKWYNSTYFSKTDEITIRIKGGEWITQEKRYGVISNEKQTIENLPDGIEIYKMELNKDNSLSVELRTPVENDILKAMGEVVFIKNREAIDYGEGGLLTGSTWESTDGVEQHCCIFTIPDFKENTFEMEWYWGEYKELESPVEIVVK